MTMTWGIVARSRSTGIQIRKALAQPFTDPAEAQVAADTWQLELNTDSKFGLTDWSARYDAAEGGPGEDNINPSMITHPQNAQPSAQPNASYRGEQIQSQGATGMNGRL